MNKLEWKRWKMGWGESVELAPGLKMSVAASMERGNKNFSFNVFGLRSKNEYPTMDAAKQVAEKYAKDILEMALSKFKDED